MEISISFKTKKKKKSSLSRSLLAAIQLTIGPRLYSARVRFEKLEEKVGGVDAAGKEAVTKNVSKWRSWITNINARHMKSAPGYLASGLTHSLEMGSVTSPDGKPS